MQKLIIDGIIAKEPEMRYTPNGSAVTKLTVAESFVKKDGTKSPTTWFRVTVWGELAEKANQFSKGNRVHIEGRLTPDESGNPRVFQRKDETWGASYEVNAWVVELIVKDEEVPF